MTTLQSASRPPHGPGAAPRPDPAPGPGSAAGPDSARGSVLEPGRRLSPSPQGDRSWRLLITLLGAIVLLLLLLGLTAVSVSSWLTTRSFSEIPATTGLGTPSALELTNDLGDVHVLRSADVDEVTLAFVEEGSTTLPADGATAQASIDRTGGADAPSIAVRQPGGPAVIPWENDTRDLLLLVPNDLDLSLDLTSTVGDVDATGSFSSLAVASEVGDVRLASVAAPGGLTVTSDVGDVEVELEGPTPDAVEVTTSVGNADLLLPVDASGDVAVSSELGDVYLTAPGTTQWSVTASTELGERSVDPSFTARTGDEVGTLTVTSELGNVTVSR
ncbi:MAG: DUF4097 family beta strand repeat-containing protein [Brachybacterium tyrofermentans]|uniref:DUF4097 family beta strand repeat-containing protein n=1 Tax=Brachybacterium tyrofermentans TaxID=47848 RepID=A0ABW0FE90_9MICO|nr:DUF4097 family beta strand repeat-containing protein [Brachybacterium tyrofermentans]